MILSRIGAVLDRIQASITFRLMMRLGQRRLARAGLSEQPLHLFLDVWSRMISATADSTDDLRRSIRNLLLAELPPEARSLVPALEIRDVPVMNTWTYQNQVMKWDIAPKELVLDLGSGGWPFSRADHLADKFPEQTTHRVESIIRDGRPFCVVDIHHLPFKDDAYDFVFCSHVLEHLDNPGQAIRELTRIARKGYLEVPSRLSDVMFNFTRLTNHHRWHGLVLAGVLVLIEWTDAERRELGNQYFDALHCEYSNQFQTFFERNRDLFFAALSWSDEISFLIIDKSGVVIDRNPPLPSC